MNNFLTIILFILWLAVVISIYIALCLSIHTLVSILRGECKTKLDIILFVIGTLRSILILFADIIIIILPFI